MTRQSNPQVERSATTCCRTRTKRKRQEIDALAKETFAQKRWKLETSLGFQRKMKWDKKI